MIVSTMIRSTKFGTNRSLFCWMMERNTSLVWEFECTKNVFTVCFGQCGSFSVRQYNVLLRGCTTLVQEPTLQLESVLPSSLFPHIRLMFFQQIKRRQCQVSTQK